MVYRVSSAHEEGGERLYSVSTQQFLGDAEGNVRALELVEVRMADGRFEPDLAMIGKSEVVAYLVDWSFTGEDDKPVKCSADAIDSLTVDTYDEIEKAIQSHIKRVEDERKNATSGTSSS